jgi:imidazolonepropionase-like amidohydrolase
MRQYWYLFLGLLPALVSASDEIPGPPQKEPIAIVGATIHPISGPDIEQGTILFDQGRIIELGRNVTPPSNARIIQGSGRHVYPGLIGAHTALGLEEVEYISATVDDREFGDINPNLRVDKAYNPDSELIPVTRSNGVLMVITTPKGGLLSGMAALMMLDGWTQEDVTLKPSVGLVVQWPAMIIADGENAEKRRKTRDLRLRKLHNAFADARAYDIAKSAEAQAGIPYHDVDGRWEAMRPVLRGEVSVFIVANTVDRIRAAVHFADTQQLKIVLVGGAEAWMVTDLLKARNIPVILEAVNRLPERRHDAYDAAYTLPRQLSDAGIRFAIGNTDEANERHLASHAAQAVAFGLPMEEALKALTLYAAQICGADDRVGSLEAGKDATLIITDGNPLEYTTSVEQAFIQGRDVQLTNRHTRLYDKYRERYRQLNAQ